MLPCRHGRGGILADMLPERIQRALVVEDDPALRAALARTLEAWGARVSTAVTAADARQTLAAREAPDLILVDVRLPDGPVEPFLQEAAELAPAPIVVAMSGVALPEETFQLASLGVRAYLAKPFGHRQLAESIQEACREPRLLRPVVRALVGRVSLRDLQRQVREVMVREALARSDGNRSGAARLLQVTRQAVQHTLRSGALDEPR